MKERTLSPYTCLSLVSFCALVLASGMGDNAKERLTCDPVSAVAYIRVRSGAETCSELMDAPPCRVLVSSDNAPKRVRGYKDASQEYILTSCRFVHRNGFVWYQFFALLPHKSQFPLALFRKKRSTGRSQYYDFYVQPCRNGGLMSFFGYRQLHAMAIIVET